MGGVDRLDQNVAQYRISIRKKKWWWSIFSFLVSASVNNAWLLYRESLQSIMQPLDLLQFTRRIVNTYVQRNVPKDTPSSNVRDLRVLPEVRFDSIQHFIESIDKQRRCGECGKKVKRQCRKCCVALHVDCFKNYHAK